MSNIALQIERSTAGDVNSGSNVVFDTTVYTAGNISYNSTTGVITFNEVGRYAFDWWVATQSSESTNGAVFVLSSSQSDTLEGNSPIKTGEVVGFGIIDVTTAPVTVSLVNGSSDNVCYSPVVPLTATLVVIQDDVVLAEGFSAFVTGVTASTNTQLAGWTVTSPYFGSTNFDDVLGNYTVPVTGHYSINATINYSELSVPTVTLPPGIDPEFVVRRTSPAAADLVNGLFPLLDVNIALTVVRSILRNGTVTLAGDVDLTAGDVIGLFYNADGLTATLTLGGVTGEGIVWSINRLT